MLYLRFPLPCQPEEQLLDEMADGGLVFTTEANMLQELVAGRSLAGAPLCDCQAGNARSQCSHR